MKSYKSTNPSTVFRLLLCLIVISIWSCESPTKEPAPKKVSEIIKETKTPVILCFGNSLTEGYGLSSEESFPTILQQYIDSLNYNYQIVNAGLSGETTTGGKGRLNWVLKNNIEVFILELGANDGLRGIPITETEKNLQALIDTVRAKNEAIKIILAGMQIPPNMGQEYTEKFKEIFPRLKEKNNTYLIPFLLENVASYPELNQKDGIHPTAEGTKIVAKNVWKLLEPLLKK
jgi:acyl-CoA thioesterase-1